MATIKVTIREDQRKWLTDHPAINFSGFVTSIVNTERKKPNPFTLPYIITPRSKDGSAQRSVGRIVTVSDEEKEFLRRVRAKHANKHFLSVYVQMKLDHVIDSKSLLQVYS